MMDGTSLSNGGIVINVCTNGTTRMCVYSGAWNNNGSEAVLELYNNEEFAPPFSPSETIPIRNVQIHQFMHTLKRTSETVILVIVKFARVSPQWILIAYVL